MMKPVFSNAKKKKKKRGGRGKLLFFCNPFLRGKGGEKKKGTNSKGEGCYEIDHPHFARTLSAFPASISRRKGPWRGRRGVTKEKRDPLLRTRVGAARGRKRKKDARRHL